MSYANPVMRKKRYPQKATYWAARKKDGFGGETWVAPVIIDCRWENHSSENLSVAYKVEGESVVSDAHVFTMIPLIEGAYLFLGETSEANPSRMKEVGKTAYVIRKISHTPGVRGNYTEYLSFL